MSSLNFLLRSPYIWWELGHWKTKVLGSVEISGDEVWSTPGMSDGIQRMYREVRGCAMVCFMAWCWVVSTIISVVLVQRLDALVLSVIPLGFVSLYLVAALPSAARNYNTLFYCLESGTDT